ncbi:hypothetical protein [Mesobacillus zeae]|nr:hypothetical protein [Mesobacillus zeae]
MATEQLVKNPDSLEVKYRGAGNSYRAKNKVVTMSVTVLSMAIEHCIPKSFHMLLIVRNEYQQLTKKGCLKFLKIHERRGFYYLENYDAVHVGLSPSELETIWERNGW